MKLLPCVGRCYEPLPSSISQLSDDNGARFRKGIYNKRVEEVEVAIIEIDVAAQLLQS
jgi:hypothetical protein